MEEIEKILQTTGLSCDELLKKLQFYKTIRTNNENDENSSLQQTDKTCTAETVITQLESSSNSNSVNHDELNNNDNNDKNGEIITENLENVNKDPDDDHKNEQITGNLQGQNEDQDSDNRNETSAQNNQNDDNETKTIVENLLDTNEDPDEDHNNEQIIENLQGQYGDQDTGNTNETSVQNHQKDDNEAKKVVENLQDTNEDPDDDHQNEQIIENLQGQYGDQQSDNEMEKVAGNLQDTNEDQDEDRKIEKNLISKEDSVANENIIDDGIDVSNQSTEDDLINNIKLQLSSLRNKKKTNSYITDFSKKPLPKFESFIKKSKQIAEIHSSISNDDTDDNKQQQQGNDPLITSTDETQFVILDVTGGVDLVEENNQAETKEQQSEKVEGSSNSSLNDPNFPQVKKIRLSEQIFIKNNEEAAKTTIVETNVNKDKSPFISDKLEDFLNENSKLKISYTIPKLGAEDGLMETMKQSPYDGKINNNNDRGNNDRGKRILTKKITTKLVKARTLAEMRRQFETIKNAENHENDTKRININSFVLYKNQKLSVPSRKQNSCLCVIDDDKKMMKKMHNSSDNINNTTTRKLSLLSTMMHESQPPKVSYKPGPLSKKIELQSKESCKFWKTEIKKLPKIYFEVIPEINKSIENRFLHLLPILDDAIITKERAEFALSVLKQPGDQQQQQQIFKFPVSYQNKQEKILVRRPIINNDINRQNNDNKLENCDNKVETEVEIKSILDDMIRYVEIKQIGDDLIKDDDDLRNDNNINNIENDNVKQKNLIKKKRKRIDVELQRLNCKIINIENDDNKNDNDDIDQYCNKSYCKFGCVCKSLSCEPILLNHCHLIDCMFECKCPKKQDSSLFNECKMYHLNEQIKKNLAKVEREFTQTIIQQGNEMFIMGNNDDNKKNKRTSKAPKRYHDYDYDIDKIFDTKTATTTTTKKVQQPEIKYDLKECRVNLIKLNNLDCVIPFCLEHFRHDCSCGGLIVSNKMKKIEKAAKIAESSARIRPIFSTYRERNKHPAYKNKLFNKTKVMVDQSNDNINNNDNNNEIIVEIKEEFQPTTSNNSVTKASKRKQAFEKIREDLDENFAIQRRNNNNNNNNNDNNNVKRLKPTGNTQYHPIFEGEIQVPLKHNVDILKIIGQKNAHLEYFRILPWNQLIKGYNNNEIKIWCTVGRPNTLLCNRSDAVPPKNCIDIKKSSSSSSINNEIIKWINCNKLPVNLCADKSFVILTPTKNHFLLVGFCEKNSTIREKLKTHSAKSLEQIVSSSSSSSSKASHATLSRILSSPPVSLKSSSSSSTTTTETRGMKLKHKDMNNCTQILYITNRYFASKLFYCHKSNNNDNLDVSLPKLSKTSRWYMMYLNSDFTYLLFKKSKYTIKYTDLMDFINMSRDFHKTVIIKTEQIVKHYLNNTKFGVYCVPQYQDRLFIGPYLYDEDHNIDTLRYINGKLYCTNVYHQIQGKLNNYKKPLWIYEWKQSTRSNHKSIIDTYKEHNNINDNNVEIDFVDNNVEIDTVDINADDNDDVIIVNDPLAISTINTKNTDTENAVTSDVSFKEFYNQNLFMLPFVKELTTTEMTARKQTNRFIITNIPHLGYLEAYQYDTKMIDIFWPENITGYRFLSVNFAKDSLIQYFSQIFCPVNGDLQISVVILTELDLNVNKPMDVKYLTKPGPYICGDFGVYSDETVPQEFLKTNNITSIEPLLCLEQRDEENFDRLVHLFGMFLMTNPEQRQYKTTKEILDWAKSEIYVLKRLSANYESEKTDLQYLHRFNCLQIKKLLLPLPLEERKKYYNKIMEVKRSKRPFVANNNRFNQKQRIDEMQITETIEINDSDDETEQNQQADETKTEETQEQDGRTVSNDVQVERFVQLAKVGTVVQPIFQPIINSGIIQKGSTSNRSLLKHKFTPGQTLLIAQGGNKSNLKIAAINNNNNRSEIMKNLDNSTKVVNNIITNVTQEIT